MVDTSKSGVPRDFYGNLYGSLHGIRRRDPSPVSSSDNFPQRLQFSLVNHLSNVHSAQLNPSIFSLTLVIGASLHPVHVESINDKMRTSPRFLQPRTESLFLLHQAR